LEPFRSDNAKLVKVCSAFGVLRLIFKEVNELHMELIRRRDVADAQLKKLKAGFRKVEHENSDLRFLNTQYAHKLRVLEKESQVCNLIIYLSSINFPCLE
jgi:centrosomal protein CEP135